MSINTLVCEKRDLAIKAKIIRKNGFVPAVVYGRHIDSLSIQIQQEAAMKFLQIHSRGSQVLLEIDGKEQLAILKEFHRDPLSRKIIHIEFHALTSGEKVNVTLPIKYMNKDSLEQDTYLQVQMNEIDISALPEFLIDHVNIDLSKYNLGDSVFVKDLDVSNDENIEVISHQDSLVCTITHAAKFEEELPDDEVETDEEAESTKTTEE
ncbi:MAG: 50S ribosomal protein L25 [Clostridia bacterium]